MQTVRYGTSYPGSSVGGLIAGGSTVGFGGGQAGILDVNGLEVAGGGVYRESDVGCMGCFERTTGPAAMTYVGLQKGDYITETTFKYVGENQGMLALVAPKKSCLVQVLCALNVLLLLALLALFAYWPMSTTTTPRPPMPPTTPPPPSTTSRFLQLPGTCLFWGDPHVVTFDNARPSFYGEGEFWIVNSTTVHIQGRYMATPWTDGLAATNKIVIGGPFLKGHRIAVGPLEGNGSGIFVDGQPVLTTIGETYRVQDLATLTYNSEGLLVDEGQKQFGKHFLHMDLPLGVRVTVDRWRNYIDLKLMMTPQPGQDGSCGNFNGKVEDDTTEAIMERVGARVRPRDLLFDSIAKVQFSAEMMKMLLEDCAPEKLKLGKAECQGGELPVEEEHESKDVDSCIFDHCYGADVHALREARTFD